MPIAALIDTAILSGPGRQLVAQGARMIAQGRRFDIVTFQREGRPVSPFVAYAQAHGVPVHVIAEGGRSDLTVVVSVRRVLESLGSGVVQTHGYRPSAIVAALRALRWFGGAWVGFYHGGTAEDWKVQLYDQLDRRLLRRADRVIVMSRLQQAMFSDLGARVSVVYNAVLDAAATGSADQGVELPPSTRPRLGVIGRLSHEKGVDLLLEAFARARRAGADIELVIAGDGPARAALEAQSERLSLGDAVRFVGQVANVGALYPALDLVVIPSRSEGLPNVLLEAIRHDRHVLSTRVGAVPDVLEGTRAGRLVPVGDVQALADAIPVALAERRDAAATSDRAMLAARFSLDGRIDAIGAVHRDALAARAAHR